MAVFDWNQKIEQIPGAWRDTGGAGVRIAIIDSGFDIAHADLTHLSTHARFFVARSGYDPQKESLPTDDPVAEEAGAEHGTSCLSVLAARTTHPDGTAGMAPLSEYLLIKATDEQQSSKNVYFLKALQVALRHRADVVMVSYVPTEKFNFQKTQIQSLFEEMKNQKVALCVALDNTDIFAELIHLRYPANQPLSVNTGVVTKALLASRPPDAVFDPGIFALLQPVEVRFCKTGGDYVQEQASSSIANACFAGIVALCIAHWKKTEGEGYAPRSKEDLLTALAPVLFPMDNLEMEQPAYRFYSPAKTTATNPPA